MIRTTIDRLYIFIGEVPNLFAPDEKASILERIQEK